MEDRQQQKLLAQLALMVLFLSEHRFLFSPPQMI